MGERDEPLPPGVLQARGHQATVTFDGATVTIKRERASPHGAGTSLYPVGQISGVQVSRSSGQIIPTGMFTLVVAGGVQRSQGMKRGDARKDPLTVLFPLDRVKEFDALAGAVSTALVAPAGGPASPAGPDLATQLANLANLHAAGALTDTEFATAKARLIGGRPRDGRPRGGGTPQ